MRKGLAVNTAHDNHDSDDAELDYQAGNRRSEASREPRVRRPQHVRTSRPTGFNGKHRRRNKRYMC